MKELLEDLNIKHITSLPYPFENGNKFIFQQFLSFSAPPNPSIIIGAETPLPSGGFSRFQRDIGPAAIVATNLQEQ